MTIIELNVPAETIVEVNRNARPSRPTSCHFTCPAPWTNQACIRMRTRIILLCMYPLLTSSAQWEEPGDATLFGLALGPGESKRHARPLASAFPVYRHRSSGARGRWEVSMMGTPPSSAQVRCEASRSLLQPRSD